MHGAKRLKIEGIAYKANVKPALLVKIILACKKERSFHPRLNMGRNQVVESE